MLTLSIAALLYWSGWWRLRHRGHRQLANGWRLASFSTGVLVLVLALMSGIDSYQSHLFLMHMIQHILLAMIAPLLLLLGSPLPISLWALPQPLRRSMRHLLSRHALFRRALRAITSPTVVWMLYVGTYWGWHDPAAYNAALSNPLIHNVEHLSFFLTAMLFWWRVTESAPRIHHTFSYGGRVMLVMMVFFVNLAASIAIAMSDQVIYTHYLEVERLWSLSALQDQRIGGLIMWIPGSMMYVIVALTLLVRLMAKQEGAVVQQT